MVFKTKNKGRQTPVVKIGCVVVGDDDGHGDNWLIIPIAITTDIKVYIHGLRNPITSDPHFQYYLVLNSKSGVIPLAMIQNIAFVATACAVH